MGKKLSRARRKELREQGLLEPPSGRARIEDERTPRRGEAAPALRVETAEDVEEEERAAPRTRAARRDRTLLVLLALTAGAGLIFWLTQRSPQHESKMIDVPPPMGVPTGTGK